MYKLVVRGIILLFAFNCFAAETVDVESLKISNVTTVVSVSTTATLLPATALSGRKTILVQNISGTKTYLGNADVTADEASTGGYQLTNEGDVWVGDFSDDNLVYGIVASGTAATLVWEAR